MIQPHKPLTNFYIQVPEFGNEAYGLKGVGVNHVPIISMDPYIDTSMNDELHRECVQGLAKSQEFGFGMFPGSIHSSDEKELNQKNWTTLLANIEQNDPTGEHRQNIRDLLRYCKETKENPMVILYKYAYFAMGSTIPWMFTVYLKRNIFRTKTGAAQQFDWTDTAKQHFPKVMKYIESLPFKSVGRVLFFTTYPNARVPAHRDWYLNPHKDHNINLFFNAGWRPSYVLDDINNKKHYLPEGATSYFFNNRDYHGVDAVSEFRYTLRVDGVFEDSLAESLGLRDGFVWTPEYDK